MGRFLQPSDERRSPETIARDTTAPQGFVTVFQIPCSVPEQDENSLFRTLLGAINSLFQWDRGPATVGLQSEQPTEIATVFGAYDKMAASRIVESRKGAVT
jgi:hypothetical protein